MAIPRGVQAVDRQTARIALLEAQRKALMDACIAVKAVADRYGVRAYGRDIRAAYDDLSFAMLQGKPVTAEGVGRFVRSVKFAEHAGDLEHPECGLCQRLLAWTSMSVAEVNTYHKEGGIELLAKDAQQIIRDWADRENKADANAVPEQAELLHKEEFSLDDLVQTDLTGLSEAVEEYIEEYVLGADLDPDQIDYGWSCKVVVKITKKREEVKTD